MGPQESQKGTQEERAGVMETVRSPKILLGSWLLSGPRRGHHVLEVPATCRQPEPQPQALSPSAKLTWAPAWGRRKCWLQSVPASDVEGTRNLLLRIDTALTGYIIPALTEPRIPCTNSSLGCSHSLKFLSKWAGEQLHGKDVKPVLGKGGQMGKDRPGTHSRGMQGFTGPQGVTAEIILFSGAGGGRMLLLEWKVLGKE